MGGRPWDDDSGAAHWVTYVHYITKTHQGDGILLYGIHDEQSSSQVIGYYGTYYIPVRTSSV